MVDGIHTNVKGSPRKGFSYNLNSMPGTPDDGPARGGNEHKEKRRTRGDPEWYQSLVEYWDRRIQDRLRWWDAVDREYEQRNVQDTLVDSEVIDLVRPGRVYSLVHTVEAQTFNRKPKIFLRGYNAKVQEDWIPIFEDVLNAEWYDEPTLPLETSLCIRDCTKYGMAVMLTTYDPEFESDADPAPVVPEIASPLIDDMAAEVDGEIAAEAAASTPAPPEKLTYLQDDRVVYDAINSRRVDPRLYIGDADATCPQDAKLHGRKIVVDIHSARVFFQDQLGGDRQLHPTDRADIDIVRRSGEDTQGNSPYEYVTLYEIWEKVPGMGWRYVLVPKDHDFILDQDENKFHAGCPFHLLRWNQTGRDLWTQSDLIPAWDLIRLERTLLTKLGDAYTREAIDKYVYAKNAGISEEDLNALNDPSVDAFAAINVPDGRRIQDVIQMLPKSAKTSEAMNLLAIIEKEIQIATGLGPNQVGQALRSGTSASESMEVAGYAKARGQHKVSAVEEFVASIASFRLGLMIQFYEAERVARIVGDDAATEWSKIKQALNHPGEIQRGLRCRIEQGSMRPENDDMRVTQLTSILQLVSSQPALLASVNTNEILRDLAVSLGHHRKNKYILAGGDDEQVAQTQAAMMMMQQGGQGGSAAGAPATPSTPAGAAQQAMGTTGAPN